MTAETELFDDWPERYEEWFTTPIGGLVREFEGSLVTEMLEARPGEMILDAGCGTAVFTTDILAAGAKVAGLDVSGPMLRYALKKTGGKGFFPVRADLLRLPFKDESFDRVVSVTALEFVADARAAVEEMFRVARPGGRVVVATLNSLSPWAERRQAEKGPGHVLHEACYRSPDELLALSPYKGTVKTAIHFSKDEDPAQAREIEAEGRRRGLDTGAFVAVRWEKP